MNIYSIYKTYTFYMISISIEVMEPHRSTQVQIVPVHHGPQWRIAHTQFARNAEIWYSLKGLEDCRGGQIVPGTQHPPAWTYGSWIVPTLFDSACVLGIPKSASLWTSGTLSSKPWMGGVGGRWVPRNPENKRCMLYQFYTSICLLYTWYIHDIYWCKMKAHGGCWLLFGVYIYRYIYDIYIWYIYIYYIYVILIVYTWHI